MTTIQQAKTMTNALPARLDAHRQTVLRLPLLTRWLLFLTVWSCLTFGGIVLMASWLVPAPAQAAAIAAPLPPNNGGF